MKQMAPTIEYVLRKLDWMRARHIWPNGKRYLWTDAFGVVLLVSLYRELARKEFLEQAESVVADVERVLGRRRGSGSAKLQIETASISTILRCGSSRFRAWAR